MKLHMKLGDIKVCLVLFLLCHLFHLTLDKINRHDVMNRALSATPFLTSFSIVYLHH